MTPQPRKTVIQKLADSRAVQSLVVGLKLPQLANRFLESFPLHRGFGKMRTRYRIRRIESFIVADEIFLSKTYQNAIHPGTRTFVDIGCNTGFFCIFCSDETGRKDLEGIAIDANPEMADETRWHLHTNGLTKIDVIHGLAGAPTDQSEGTFYVSPANIASSVLPSPNPNVPKKGELKAIQVPAINLAHEWKLRHSEKRIDLLKIDVEGYEKELIENSAELLAMTDLIAVEIHKWVISPSEIESLLKQKGFELFAQEGESTHGVVAFFRRKIDNSQNGPP